MSVFIIAEAGSTHDNVLENAIRLIHAAKVSGADAVKFQTCTNIDKLMAKRGEKKEARPAYEYLKTTKDWLPTLKAECVKVGIQFGCTAFIEEDIPIVAQHVDYFKIAAKESWDSTFVDAHFSYGKRIIVSERDEYSAQWTKGGVRLDLIYCVSEYPAPLEHLKLHRIWERYDGFSDHSTSTLTGAIAVALGARVLEKHVKLSDTDHKNPDWPHSLTCDTTIPGCFEQYVKNAREAERCL